MAKSRILIIGATGYIGPYVVRASVAAGHPTFVLIRPQTAINPARSELIESFNKSGIVVIKGSLEDYASVLEAIRQVDIVISAVNTGQVLDQLNIIKAIKEVGSIKRFLPSEFGSNQVSLDGLPDVLQTTYAPKQQIRSLLASEGIPFTVIITYGFAGFFLANLGQFNCKTPPRDKVVIFGDGNKKVICVTEEDIAACTILAADDPRTENKYAHIKPPTNILSQNEVVSLWEQKIGKSLEKTHMSGESLLKLMEDLHSCPCASTLVALADLHSLPLQIFTPRLSKLHPYSCLFTKPWELKKKGHVTYPPPVEMDDAIYLATHEHSMSMRGS